jgi:hypothetical protein
MWQQACALFAAGPENDVGPGAASLRIAIPHDGNPKWNRFKS